MTKVSWCDWIQKVVFTVQSTTRIAREYLIYSPGRVQGTAFFCDKRPAKVCGRVVHVPQCGSYCSSRAVTTFLICSPLRRPCIWMQYTRVPTISTMQYCTFKDNLNPLTTFAWSHLPYSRSRNLKLKACFPKKIRTVSFILCSPSSYALLKPRHVRAVRADATWAMTTSLGANPVTQTPKPPGVASHQSSSGTAHSTGTVSSVLRLCRSWTTG